MRAAAFFVVVSTFEDYLQSEYTDVSSACDEYGGIYGRLSTKNSFEMAVVVVPMYHIAYCSYNEIPLMKDTLKYRHLG